MFSINAKRPLATFAIVAGLLVGAAPASAVSAQKEQPTKGICAFPDVCATGAPSILYNGHAGLGANYGGA